MVCDFAETNIMVSFSVTLKAAKINIRAQGWDPCGLAYCRGRPQEHHWL